MNMKASVAFLVVFLVLLSGCQSISQGLATETPSTSSLFEDIPLFGAMSINCTLPHCWKDSRLGETTQNEFRSHFMGIYGSDSVICDVYTSIEYEFPICTLEADVARIDAVFNADEGFLEVMAFDFGQQSTSSMSQLFEVFGTPDYLLVHKFSRSAFRNGILSIAAIYKSGISVRFSFPLDLVIDGEASAVSDFCFYATESTPYVTGILMNPITTLDWITLSSSQRYALEVFAVRPDSSAFVNQFSSEYVFGMSEAEFYEFIMSDSPCTTIQLTEDDILE